MTDTNKALRRELIQKRISYAEKKNNSTEVADILQKNNLIKQADHIACYLAFRGEINCEKFITAMWQQHKKIYLPVCTNKRMLFRAYNADSELKKNKYNILEPDCSNNEIAATDLDCVITPLVGFNKNNFRLGYGSGYYDQTFNFKLNNNCKPFLLGLAYDFQLTEWPTHDSDVPLDDIIIIKT
jgi:5-formyltetrahydrofolate cyclo-ligase